VDVFDVGDSDNVETGIIVRRSGFEDVLDTVEVWVVFENSTLRATLPPLALDILWSWRFVLTVCVLDHAVADQPHLRLQGKAHRK
jgi:hypothetical protein